MSRILFISNISYKISSFVTASISSANALGMDFYHASNWQSVDEKQLRMFEKEHNIKITSVQIARNPFSRENISAFNELVELVKREKIDYIHCNTPTGGILGRLAGKKCKVKKVIYQAHGFHFYKGAPLKNWLLYYPVEKILAHLTDAVITINKEDYDLAKSKLRLRKGGKVYYVPGVGIDTAQYKKDDTVRAEKRAEIGLSDGDIALISLGDLIERKNYAVAIRAVAEAQKDNLHYFICGKGPQEEELRAVAESLGVSDRVHFLGYRNDVKELLDASDIFLFTSKQEGLARSMMEAMASGLPCIASNIRGNTDLLEGAGGYLCETNNSSEYAEKIKILASDSDLRQQMSNSNLSAIQKFSTKTVYEEMLNIYRAELK